MPLQGWNVHRAFMVTASILISLYVHVNRSVALDGRRWLKYCSSCCTYSLKSVTFVLFLFWLNEDSKSALSRKMDNIRLCAGICSLRLKGLSKEVFWGHVGNTRRGCLLLHGGEDEESRIQMWQRWQHEDRWCPFSQPLLTCSFLITETETPQRLTSSFLHNHSKSWTSYACNKSCIAHQFLKWSIGVFYLTWLRSLIPSSTCTWNTHATKNGSKWICFSSHNTIKYLNITHTHYYTTNEESLKSNKSNYTILNKTPLPSSDRDGKELWEEGIETELHDGIAAAVQHLMQVQWVSGEGSYSHNGVLWNSAHRLAHSKGEELSGRKTDNPASSPRMWMSLSNFLETTG